METLDLLNSYLDQFNYYFDVIIPDLTRFQGVKRVVICAMGGSAFPVDIIADHVREAYRRDTITLNRDYDLPLWADGETLIIACSFSGSTEETLSCMNEAIEKQLPLIGVSMGGEISRICSEKNIPYISLPKIVMPRFGSGYIISTITKILTELKLLPSQSEEFKNIKIILEPLRINAQKTAEEMSKNLVDRIISIYTDSKHNAAGNIAKICINETAKVIGYHSTLSESNHNELASLSETPYKHGLILLTDPSQNPKIAQRFDLMKDILHGKDLVFEKINSNFEKILHRDIYYTMFFTYLGYYLALESKHDPVATPTQDEIKKLLKFIEKNT
jgi:glucose/mannose-6-phosphate isomerase